jgi:hypothetical protein
MTEMFFGGVHGPPFELLALSMTVGALLERAQTAIAVPLDRGDARYLVYSGTENFRGRHRMPPAAAALASITVSWGPIERVHTATAFAGGVDGDLRFGRVAHRPRGQLLKAKRPRRRTASWTIVFDPL